mgnify:CR=1 FL=1
MNALAARGLDYIVVDGATANDADVEVPMVSFDEYCNPTSVPVDLRLSDRDVILVRAGLATATVTVLVVDRTGNLNVRADSFSVPAGSSLVTLNVLENDNILPGNGEDLVVDTILASAAAISRSSSAASTTKPSAVRGTAV